MLFRMVPKPQWSDMKVVGFRAVLFRMVPKQNQMNKQANRVFRAVLFRMVPKRSRSDMVLELCCFEYSKTTIFDDWYNYVLELCCFEWFQNRIALPSLAESVLELCCFENGSKTWTYTLKIQK